MKFEGLIPVIQCAHIEQTLAFYQQAFRYIVVDKTITPDGLQWVYLKSDNTSLMLQKMSQSTTTQHQAGNIILYYYTDDITAQHNFMTARGIKAGQLEDTPYHIRQFLLEDPEGNILTVGQDSRPVQPTRTDKT